MVNGIILTSDSAQNDMVLALMLLFFTIILFIKFVIHEIKKEKKKAKIRAAEIQKEKEEEERFLSFIEGHTTFSPEEFMNEWVSYKGHLQDFDFIGCYILHNLTEDKYYVGQATHVPRRVHAHLTGHGNGDVYADYVYGDEFEIRTIELIGSGYNRLDDLERDLIDTYDAYENGYNKTSGNK